MKTKEKILNAALDVLLQEGLPALTQTRVAEVAGIRQGLLTYHFPKRMDLLTAVVDESKRRMAESRFGNNIPLTLASLKELMIHFAVNKNFPRLMLALTVAAGDDPSLSNWFVEADIDTRQKMRELIKHAGWQVEENVLHTMRSIVIGASLINLQQNTAESEARVRIVVDSAFQYLTDNLKPL